MRPRPPTYDLDHMNPIVQDRPQERCHCRHAPGDLCCDSRKCSYQSAWWYAKKKSLAYRLALAEALAEGRFAYFGHAAIGHRVPGWVVRRILGNLKEQVTPLGTYQWEAEATRAHTVHFHMVILTQAPMDTAQFKVFWRNALAEHRASGRASTQCEVVRDPVATAAYLGGYTRRKRRRLLFSKFCGFRLCGGSQRFFCGLGWKDLDKVLKREHGATRFALGIPPLPYTAQSSGRDLTPIARGGRRLDPDGYLPDIPLDSGVGLLEDQLWGRNANEAVHGLIEMSASEA